MRGYPRFCALIRTNTPRLDATAPDDNPFVNERDAIPQIWAYGLRNPFRFTFTPDGKLLAGDVGNAAWEELNIVTAGANYGWPGAEGVCEGGGCEKTLDGQAGTTVKLVRGPDGNIYQVTIYPGTLSRIAPSDAPHRRARRASPRPSPTPT